MRASLRHSHPRFATSNFWVTGDVNGPGAGASFEPIVFAEGIDRRGDPVAPAGSFAPGLEELHAFSAYSGMEDGLDVTVNWYLEGEKVVEWPYRWDGGREGTWHDLLYAKSGTLPRPLVLNTCYSIVIGAEGYWTFGQDDICIPADPWPRSIWPYS